MVVSGHNKTQCLCELYKLDYKIYDIRYTKDSRYCKTCRRYITVKKWKGGILKFANRVRILTKEFCPCCGDRLRVGRRGKKKMVDSVKDQQKNPEKYNKVVLKKLNKKIKYLQKVNLLVVRK